MNSQNYFGIFLASFLIFGGINCLTNYTGTSDFDCIACLCFVRTQCFNLSICANYVITYEYWEHAGAPTLVVDGDVTEENYRECMANDNCVVNTILRYMQNFEQEVKKKDCVCDDTFDCRDMLSLHILGSDNCQGLMPKRHGLRYNFCARTRQLPILDPTVECIGEPAEEDNEIE